MLISCSLSLKKDALVHSRRQHKVQNQQDISQSSPHSTSLLTLQPTYNDIPWFSNSFLQCLLMLSGSDGSYLFSHTRYCLAVAPNAIKQNVTLA